MLLVHLLGVSFGNFLFVSLQQSLFIFDSCKLHYKRLLLGTNTPCLTHLKSVLKHWRGLPKHLKLLSNFKTFLVLSFCVLLRAFTWFGNFKWHWPTWGAPALFWVRWHTLKGASKLKGRWATLVHILNYILKIFIWVFYSVSGPFFEGGAGVHKSFLVQHCRC
jgi:hypothetical protein